MYVIAVVALFTGIYDAVPTRSQLENVVTDVCRYVNASQSKGNSTRSVESVPGPVTCSVSNLRD